MIIGIGTAALLPTTLKTTTTLPTSTGIAEKEEEQEVDLGTEVALEDDAVKDITMSLLQVLMAVSLQGLEKFQKMIERGEEMEITEKGKNLPDNLVHLHF